MLASMTPTGKRKFPFVHGNCQNIDSSGNSAADMKENLPVTDVPIPKRQCTSCHNVITGVTYSVENNSMTANTDDRSDVQRTNNLGTSSSHHVSMEVKYSEQEAMNNNDEMETEPPSNLCSRCRAGESGHIRHIFH